MTAIKLFATDVDGTLIGSDGHVSLMDKNAIELLRAHEIHVTIATGRLYSGIRHLVEQLQISVPVVTVDGAQVIDPLTNETIFHQPIRVQDAEFLRHAIHERQLITFAVSNDTIVHDGHGVAYRPYLSYWSPVFAECKEVLAHPCWHSHEETTSVICLGDEVNVLSLSSEISGNQASAMMCYSFPVKRFFMDHLWACVVRATGVHKGLGLRFLQERLSISQSACATIGDWLNDIPMFHASGLSFAVGNASEEVRTAATHQLREPVGKAINEAVKLILSSTS